MYKDNQCPLSHAHIPPSDDFKDHLDDDWVCTTIKTIMQCLEIDTSGFQGYKGRGPALRSTATSTSTSHLLSGAGNRRVNYSPTPNPYDEYFSCRHLFCHCLRRHDVGDQIEHLIDGYQSG